MNGNEVIYDDFLDSVWNAEAQDSLLKAFERKSYQITTNMNQEKLGLTTDTSISQVDIHPYPNTIVCGDSATVLKKIPSNSIHLIITSPPYWNLVNYGFEEQIGQTSYEKYLNDLLIVWNECERVLVPNGKLCINVPIVPVPKSQTPHFHTRDIKNIANDIEYSILSTLSLRRYSLYLWQKQTTEKMFGSYPYLPNIYENNTIEFINVYIKEGKPRKIAKAIKESSKLTQAEWLDLTRQIWWIYPQDVSRSGNHPAPFPLLLPSRLCKMYTFRAVPEEKFEGDIVLDPFVGSGTTCVAAKMLGRRYIGIDGSTNYVTYAKSAINNTDTDIGYDISLRRLSDGDKELENQKHFRGFT